MKEQNLYRLDAGIMNLNTKQSRVVSMISEGLDSLNADGEGVRVLVQGKAGTGKLDFDLGLHSNLHPRRVITNHTTSQVLS